MTRYCTAYGAYEIDSTPGQPQVAHCHSFFVKHEHRGQGLAHGLKKHQNMTLAALGYDFATCTVAASNTAQKRVLEAAGWSQLSRFDNVRTGEMTELWGRSLHRIVTEENDGMGQQEAA